MAEVEHDKAIVHIVDYGKSRKDEEGRILSMCGKISPTEWNVSPDSIPNCPGCLKADGPTGYYWKKAGLPL